MTVLVVDDAAIIREPIAASLRLHGYDVLMAADGVEALEILLKKQITVLVLDVMMPRMNGFELLATLRDRRGYTTPPVILLTAASDRITVNRAVALGVRQYLLKSQFSTAALIGRIEKLRNERTTQASEMTALRGAGRASAANPSGKSPAKKASPSSSRAAAAECEPEASRTDLLKDRKPLLGRQEVIDRIESCGEMKAMNATVAELLRLTNSSSASLESVTKVIRRDHAVALQVLKLANSALHSRGEHIDALETAVIRIGLGAIREAVLHMAVLEHFGSTGVENGIDLQLFWEHSVGCGLIASEVAKALAVTDPSRAFTIGLIHDVGRLIYADQFREEYAEVLRTARDLGVPLERAEARLLLLDHADCMDRILHQWNFPKDLIDPVVYHHMSIGNIRRVAPRRVDEVASLALADRLAHALLLGHTGNDTIYPTAEFFNHLKLTPQFMERIESTAVEATETMKLAMLSTGRSHDWTSRRDSIRAELGCEIRPLFVSAHAPVDAYRVFFDQVAAPADVPINLGVLHIANAKEQRTLTAAYLEAEKEHGTTFPLLVLSPVDDLKLDPGTLARPQLRRLGTPTPVQSIVAVASELCSCRKGTALSRCSS